MDYRFAWKLVVLVGFVTVDGFNKTSPDESLYEISLEISTGCREQSYKTLCSGLSSLNYKQCILLTENCKRVATLQISFTTFRLREEIKQDLLGFTAHAGMTITNPGVSDINECSTSMNECSKNGYCTNSDGAYECQCGLGYKEVSGSDALPGTYCVARCNARSCRRGVTCTEATDEDSEVKCQCDASSTGDQCQQASTIKLPDWSIILIAVFAGLAAVVGLSLCIYTCFRLFCKKPNPDDMSDTNSLNSYKPRAIPGGEYDRITDIGSLSRANRGYASTIDEESEHGFGSVKNDGLKFGTRLMSSRLSIPSEHGDPTPVLNPYTRTDRHAASDIVSQPDYY